MDRLKPTPLVQIVDAALASSARRSGAYLTCHAGCSPCCHGVFEISGLDAARLREGLAAAEAEVAERIRLRVAEARRRLEPFFPGDASSGLLSADPDAVERFEEWAHEDRCPVLDPFTHICDLYRHRPILCRTFGPPIRNDAADAEAGLAICELNFNGATDGEIAAAEMDSSCRGEQERLEREYDESHPGAGPTMIPFAFRVD